jgi:hypothetical protein
MSKKETKKINIAISPELLKKLEEGNYNKNKLIINLFKNFLLKKEKN